jgi:hypothetical protein
VSLPDDGYAGSGTASNNTTLGLTYDLLLPDQAPPISLQISFMAAGLFTATIDELGDSASASVAWSFVLTDEAGNLVSAWNPGSLLSGNSDFFGGTEYAFGDINAAQNITSPGSNVDEAPGDLSFEFETDPLSAGRYSLSVVTSTTADGTTDVPVPGTLGLLGLGLLGAGALRRRNK